MPVDQQASREGEGKSETQVIQCWAKAHGSGRKCYRQLKQAEIHG